MFMLLTLTLRLIWLSIAGSFDLLFYIFTLGKTDPRTRRFF